MSSKRSAVGDATFTAGWCLGFFGGALSIGIGLFAGFAWVALCYTLWWVFSRRVLVWDEEAST